MESKTFYIVQYNDCYGNNNTSFETLVSSQSDFDIWLKNHNESRNEEGEMPESSDEFTLTPIKLYNPTK